MSIAVSLIGGVLLIGAIIAVNGYFVAQEFSYMAVDRSRLNSLAAQGDKSAQRTLKITDRTSFMLSGAQLGITVTGLLVGYAAEPLIGASVGELLGGVGVPAATGIAIGTIGTLVVATFVQMLFGELFPKNLSIARPYPVAQRLSGSTLLYMRTFGWLIRVFDAASNGLLRLLRIEPVHDVAHSANLHDLQRIVSASEASGELPADLSLVLDRMIDFPERDVDHALVPRSRVDTFAADTDLRDVLRAMQGGHSRYPVLDGAGDIVGVVHLVDVIEALRPCEDHEHPASATTVREVSRRATVLSALMRLPDALAEMTEAGDQLACVVDEFGGFAGIITLEDLVEEVVGEITDEHDAEEEPRLVPAGAERTWTVRGDAPLDEVEREVGAVLPHGDFETIAGLVIAEHGALPAEGATVEVHLPPDPLELAHSEHPPQRTLRAEVLEVARFVPAHLHLELVGPPLPGREPTPAEQPQQTEEVSR